MATITPIGRRMQRLSEPCGKRKKAFRTPEEAEVTAVALARHGKSSEHVCVYWCALCDGFHWGNAFGKTVPFLPQGARVAKLSV
jgi:hypothetical protein